MTASAPTKIVVTGPFGAGKTTFVSTLSQDPVVSTERAVSDATVAVKTSTTVAMDHGGLHVTPPPGASWGARRVGLFGTPGQQRFSFMWTMLARDMDGYVVLVDASRSESVAQARDIVAAFADLAPYVPRLVLVSRWADPAGTRAELAAALGTPVQSLMPCDPRNLADATAALHVLLDGVQTLSGRKKQQTP